ncbi:MAG: alpha/beta hydrolase fold domain-containing protein [Myxococcaceae bacterium]
MRAWVSLMAVVFAGCGPAERLGVAYDERYGSDTVMDVYLPEGGGTLRPAVLLVHGGAWVAGSKENYTQTAGRLARSGYVAATINYRLAPGSRYPAAIQDSWCALSFLRAHAIEYGLDPGRVAAMGYSAGGHLVSMLGVSAKVEEVQPDCAAGRTGPADAVVSGAGVHDIRELPEVEATRQFFGGPLLEHQAELAVASPITHVGPGLPPFLLITGTVDAYVNPGQSVRMRDALVAQGNEATVLTLLGGGHVLNPTSDLAGVAMEISTESPEGWEATIDFLRATLGPAEGSR